MYKSVLIHEENEQYRFSIETKSLSEFDQSGVHIKVLYSSLNYKDALSATGNKGVTKNYPHTPGIDAVGIVVNSFDSKFLKDDLVVVTGFDFGMNTSGGWSQYIRVPAEWIVKLDPKTNPLEVMAYGTAGFTAALSIKEIIDFGVKPSDGSIVVTGATGGVGSIAASILSKLGYQVVAVSRKVDSDKAFLNALGVHEILDFKEFTNVPDRPVLKPRWIAAIDTIGGSTLDLIIKQTMYRGVVTTCGNASGISFSSSVFPFILRGVRLIGIDSVNYPIEDRHQIWHLMLNEWKPKNLLDLCKVHALELLEKDIEAIKAGTHTGRVIVDLK